MIIFFLPDETNRGVSSSDDARLDRSYQHTFLQWRVLYVVAEYLRAIVTLVRLNGKSATPHPMDATVAAVLHRPSNNIE